MKQDKHFQHRGQEERRSMAEQLMEKLPHADEVELSVLVQPPETD